MPVTTKSIWLSESTYHVHLDGKSVRDEKVAYHGYERTKRYATPEAARARFDALVRKYEELAAAEKKARRKAKRAPAARTRGVSKAKSASSKRGDLDPIACPPWRKSDVGTVERALSKPKQRIELPASFRAFVTRDHARPVDEGAEESDSDLRVLSPKEMVRDTKTLVRVPRGVRWETDDGTEVTITTDHLVAFAADGPEARWCFCVDPPKSEPPVYLHHQDEPRAKLASDGTWISKSAAKPDFANFKAWLRAFAR